MCVFKMSQFIELNFYILFVCCIFIYCHLEDSFIEYICHRSCSRKFASKICKRNPNLQHLINETSFSTRFSLSVDLLFMRRRSSVFPSSVVTDSVSFMVTLPVYHPISCSYCRGNGMTGFRYRCLRCRGYQLCQNCFWRGNASGSHNNQHQMKEHSSWVSHW